MLVIALTLGDDVVGGMPCGLVNQLIVDTALVFDDGGFAVFGNDGGLGDGLRGVVGFYDDGFHGSFLFMWG